MISPAGKEEGETQHLLAGVKKSKLHSLSLESECNTQKLRAKGKMANKHVFLSVRCSALLFCRIENMQKRKQITTRFHSHRFNETYVSFL